MGLSAQGKPKDYHHRQVEGWAKQYYALKQLKATIFSALFFLLPISASCQTTGFSWSFPIGGRPMGMGEAVTADPAGPSTIWWNPAGLALLKGDHLFYMHEELFELVPHETLVYTKNFKSFALGFFASRSDFSKALGFRWEEESRFFSFASPLNRQKSMMIGINIKQGHRSTSLETGTFEGLDAGLLFQLAKKARLGIVVQDILAKASFSTGSRETLDPHTAVGFSFKPNDATTLNLDLKDFHSNDLDVPIQTKIGLEYWLNPHMAVRGGHIFSEQKNTTGFTAGFGIAYGHLQVDYAYNPNTFSSESSRFSLTYSSFLLRR